MGEMAYDVAAEISGSEHTYEAIHELQSAASENHPNATASSASDHQVDTIPDLEYSMASDGSDFDSTPGTPTGTIGSTGTYETIKHPFQKEGAPEGAGHTTLDSQTSFIWNQNEPSSGTYEVPVRQSSDDLEQGQGPSRSPEGHSFEEGFYSTIQKGSSNQAKMEKLDIAIANPNEESNQVESYLRDSSVVSMETPPVAGSEYVTPRVEDLAEGSIREHSQSQSDQQQRTIFSDPCFVNVVEKLFSKQRPPPRRRGPTSVEEEKKGFMR